MSQLVEKQLSTYRNEIADAKRRLDKNKLNALLDQASKEMVGKISYKEKSKLIKDINTAIDDVNTKQNKANNELNTFLRSQTALRGNETQNSNKEKRKKPSSDKAKLDTLSKIIAEKQLQDLQKGKESNATLYNSIIVSQNGDEMKLRVAKKDWEKLAEIADEHYYKDRTRNPGEEWAISDGTRIFANASTAIKWYTDRQLQTIDLEERTKNSKAGDRLYKICERGSSKRGTSDIWKNAYWRYAPGEEIRNALSKFARELQDEI